MIRHFKSILGSTALASILASAAITAVPSAAVQLIGVTMITATTTARWRHDDHRDVVIVDRPAVVVAPPPVVVAPAPIGRIWVEPVYRTVTEQVYVAPTYRPVTERVWMPDEYRTIPNPFSAASSQQILVKKAHYEDVTRQELVCDGHYETVSHQELVSVGHWDDACAVAIEPAPRHDSGFHLSLHF